jgi:hypothetical protein
MHVSGETRRKPAHLPSLIKTADVAHMTPHHPNPIALLVPFVYRSHHPCRATPRTLHPVLRSHTHNATNRQPTTKISTSNNVFTVVLYDELISHFGSAFVPSLTLLAVSTPTAPRSFYGLLHQQESKQESLNFRPFLKSMDTLGRFAPTRYRRYPPSHQYFTSTFL